METHWKNPGFSFFLFCEDFAKLGKFWSLCFANVWRVCGVAIWSMGYEIASVLTFLRVTFAKLKRGDLTCHAFALCVQGSRGCSFAELRLCSKFLNPNPYPKFFQIWKSDSCSNSGNHWCNRNSAMFGLKQWHLQRPRRLLLLPKILSYFGSVDTSDSLSISQGQLNNTRIQKYLVIAH